MNARLSTLYAERAAQSLVEVRRELAVACLALGHVDAAAAVEDLLGAVQDQRRLSQRRPLAERTLALIRGALRGDATESIS